MAIMTHVVAASPQVFGNSPDETAYCRLYLNRETVADAMTMIQPQLLSYGMALPPEPVLLDVSSIQVRPHDLREYFMDS